MTTQRQSISSKKKAGRLVSASAKKEKSQSECLSTMYLHISELPLINFIECCIDGNLLALVISGKPSKEELHSNWTKILEQYQTAIGDTEHRIFINSYRDIQLFDLHIKGTIICIDALRIKPEEFFIHQLQLRDRPMIRVVLNWDDQKSYNAALDKALSRVNGSKMDLEIKRKAFEALLKKREKESTKGKADRESFISNLITISGPGFPIQAKDITTFEYCERLRRHAAMVEATNKKYR